MNPMPTVCHMLRSCTLRLLIAAGILVSGTFAIEAQDIGRVAPSTIRGFVSVVEEGENGEPLLVAIVTDDGYDLQYYYVVKEGKGKELFGEIGSTMTVTGLIDRHSDGRKWVRIQRWELKSVKPGDAILRQMQRPYNESDIPRTPGLRGDDSMVVSPKTDRQGN